MKKDRFGLWYGQRKEWQKTTMALLVYLLGFMVIALAHGALFIKEGTYFIWGADGSNQMFPVFCYMQQYVRDLFAQLAAGDFRPQLYHYSLGLGGDIWTVLNWHGLGNPFYLLGLLAKPEQYPLAFSLILEVQYLLAGAAFYALARKLGARRWGAVVGAWLYVFTGFFAMTIMHPIMAHAVVYLPLLLLGAERVMRRESPLLMGIVVFLMGITGFYFAFINSVVLAFYMLIRTWQIKGESRYWSALWRNVLYGIVVYLAGLLASGAIFLPQIIGFLGSNRTGGSPHPLLEAPGVLGQWLQDALIPRLEPFVGVLALVAIALAIGRAISRKENSGPLVVGVAVVLVFIVSPFAQSALVGFGDSEYERFWYAAALLFSMAFALLADSLFELTHAQLGAAAVLVVLAVLVLAPGGLATEEWMALIFLLLTVGVVLLGQKRWWKTPAHARAARRTAVCLLAGLTVAQLSCDLYWNRATAGAGSYRVGRFASPMPAVTDQTLPEGEYRVDVAEVADRQWWSGSNVPLVGNYKGLSVYFSILDDSYTNAMLHDWALASAEQGAFSFQSLDGCVALNTLASVRYCFARPGMEGYVPFGYAYLGDTPQSLKFTIVPEQGRTLKRYENLYMLPMAYAYQAALPQQEYGALNGLQKQAAIMQVAALEEVPEQAVTAHPDLSGVKKVKMDVVAQKGLVWENGVIECNTGDGTDGEMTLQVEAPPKSEIHLALHGYATKAPALAHPEFTMEGGIHHVIMGETVDPEESWVNLGYNEKGGTVTVTMRLADGERMELDHMDAWVYDMEQYARDAQVRVDNGLHSIVAGKDSIQASSDSSEDRVVVFSIPWSSGWTASVDGVPVPTVRANSMFTGVMVPAGSHIVYMYYITPGLKLGVLCSGLGVLLLLGLYVVWRIKTKKKKVQ